MKFFLCIAVKSDGWGEYPVLSRYCLNLFTLFCDRIIEQTSYCSVVVLGVFSLAVVKTCFHQQSF